MESRTGGGWVRLFCFLTLYPSVLSIIFSREMNSLVRLKKKGMRTALNYSQGHCHVGHALRQDSTQQGVLFCS